MLRQGLRCGLYTDKPTAARQICLCDGVPAQLRPYIPQIADLFVYPKDAMLLTQHLSGAGGQRLPVTNVQKH
jgi:hypothetical protein